MDADERRCEERLGGRSSEWRNNVRRLRRFRPRRDQKLETRNYKLQTLSDSSESRIQNHGVEMEIRRLRRFRS